MTFGPPNSISSYLPIDFQIQGDENFVRELIAERQRLTANIINIKENGNYQNSELLTAQQWFSTSAAGQPYKTRYTYRMVVDFGALPNTATKSVAHGILGIDPGGAVNSSFLFTRIYGCASNQAAAAEQFIPIPYASTTALANQIEIWVDPTNVNIRTGANYAAYTAYCVLEYLKSG